MFWCPTSEFPICPSGKPTASPEVLIAVCGQLFANVSRLGVRARAIALPSLRGLIPQPSIIISTNGRGRPLGVVLIIYHRSELKLIKENKCSMLSLYHAREPDIVHATLPLSLVKSKGVGRYVAPSHSF